MTFGQAISSCYSNYATFRGRASRSEYWYFQLYHILIVIAACFLYLTGIGLFVLAIATVVNFLPSLSALVRRLHDADHSGWVYWVILIPIVGPILLIVWLCTRGTEGVNRFDVDYLSAGEIARNFADAPHDIAEQLTKLAKLRDEGKISQEEFERLKAKLI